MKGTKIEWCDDTVSPQMGCDGCELSARHGSGTCYAERLTDRYAGKKGWPASFYAPQIFPGRIEAACRWSDLTGTVRPEKPWLDGHPRTIFLDDLGDTFTPSLPIDWLAPLIPLMAASPHRWLFLTKWPQRMQEFFRRLGEVPENFLLGTSLTDRKSLSRLRSLGSIPRAAKWISFEPAIEHLDLRDPLAWATWLVLGGESGPKARPFNVSWARSAHAQCSSTGSALFVKQLGSEVRWNGNGTPFPSPVSVEESYGAGAFAVRLSDPKGGDWNEWPEDVRVREMPAYEPRGSQLALA